MELKSKEIDVDVFMSGLELMADPQNLRYFLQVWSKCYHWPARSMVIWLTPASKGYDGGFWDQSRYCWESGIRSLYVENKTLEVV